MYEKNRGAVKSLSNSLFDHMVDSSSGRTCCGCRSRGTAAQHGGLQGAAKLPLKRRTKTHKDTDNFVTVGDGPVKHPS
jgi:hypothetical protein